MSYRDFAYRQVIVHIAGDYGEKLRFRLDNIVIEDKDGKTVLQHSCHRILALLIIGHVSITSAMIQTAVKFGFQIILLENCLRRITGINCMSEGNTELRKRQYMMTDDENLIVAKMIVNQKIHNQIALLDNLKYKSFLDKMAISSLSKIDVGKAMSYKELLGMEGTASKRFFSEYFRQMAWHGRQPRKKQDIVNLLLDIGYSYLFNFVGSVLSAYGFDLYYGVYHRPFYNRMSLACDIMEPFRCIVDRRIRKMHELNQINDDDFYQEDGRWQLRHDAQKKYIALFLKDILSEKKHVFEFCKKYYKWFMSNGISSEPSYMIGGGDASDCI